MYESLKSNTDDFHLYIFAFDDFARNILVGLSLEKVTVISLNDFETDELKEAKKSRTKAEYCWTCTPSVIAYVIENYKVPDCTYIDSDLVFYSDPAILISELDTHGKNVLITDHRFSIIPRLYEEKRAGRFCVQFMTFRNELNSLAVLDKWRNQCIDWCYAKHEDGKFGDQKYLDEWPEVYDNVHILKHHGGGLAPWNLQNYSLLSENGSLYLIDKKTRIRYNLVFYHFQYVKTLREGYYDVGWYLISSRIKKLLYSLYLYKIEEWEKKLEKLNNGYSRAFSTFKSEDIKSFIKNVLKKVLHYNIMKPK